MSSKKSPRLRHRILGSKQCRRDAVYARQRGERHEQADRFPVVTSLGLMLRSAALHTSAA